jgi:SAM-dependent methyltransferase
MDLPASQLITATCVICGNETWQSVFIQNGFSIKRCTACDLQQVVPLPSNAALHAHYQNPAYFNGEETQGYASYADMHRAFLPHYRRRLRRLAQRIPCGRLLDFGCADGFFLSVARAAGWDIAGVELSHAMAEQAQRDLQIVVPSRVDELGDAQFDAITLWEVIEHLSDPLMQLCALEQRLRPGGVVMLSTPNTGHWQAQREPDRWEGYRPPSHLLFFTEKTLYTTLQRAGFTHITIERVAPLPPLPGWLRRLSAPLRHALATGHARWWPLARLSWRGIRLLGWSWQKITQPKADVYMTLEALAFKPVD